MFFLYSLKALSTPSRPIRLFTLVFRNPFSKSWFSSLPISSNNGFDCKSKKLCARWNPSSFLPLNMSSLGCILVFCQKKLLVRQNSMTTIQIISLHSDSASHWIFSQHIPLRGNQSQVYTASLLIYPLNLFQNSCFSHKKITGWSWNKKWLPPIFSNSCFWDSRLIILTTSIFSDRHFCNKIFPNEDAAALCNIALWLPFFWLFGNT